MSTVEPLHVPPGTPNAYWNPKWVAFIPAGEGGPDAELHWRHHLTRDGATVTECGALGRGLDLTDVYDRDHPVVVCPRCLRYHIQDAL